VLVAWSAPDFAAAQAARRSAAGDPWAALPAALRLRAEALAADAARGHLVLFIGAGVSAGAGLPLWDDLLGELATTAGLDSGAPERTSFAALNTLDRAEYLAQRLRDRGGVGQAVVDRLGAHRHYSLGHALLAGLPVDEAITTNYDRLFETACAATGRPCAVLPYAPAVEHDRWLLKMHGCLEHPEDIVLTRENYLRYAERNAALAGIVQAMLITRNMLFLGFSLGDDNFLRIVDSVRRAVRPVNGSGARRSHLGSAVMLADNPLLRQLWHDEIEWLCVGEPGRSIAEAARLSEIFLDCLSSHAAASTHLLDPRFAHVRTPADEALAALLDPLCDAPREVRAAAAWPLVAELLTRLGRAP
ncbi:MAG: SIR2 family protein, partial [Myxococcales bacterium]|nr:SIR2 family protein [Myxococcales bacterium]